MMSTCSSLLIFPTRSSSYAFLRTEIRYGRRRFGKDRLCKRNTYARTGSAYAMGSKTGCASCTRHLFLEPRVALSSIVQLRNDLTAKSNKTGGVRCLRSCGSYRNFKTNSLRLSFQGCPNVDLWNSQRRANSGHAGARHARLCALETVHSSFSHPGFAKLR